MAHSTYLTRPASRVFRIVIAIPRALRLPGGPSRIARSLYTIDRDTAQAMEQAIAFDCCEMFLAAERSGWPAPPSIPDRVRALVDEAINNRLYYERVGIATAADR
ncbi:hypothetical protein [Paraburkholderia dilworthii]|uniref:Uncharacterized protein n=1 Tax=Paraburkholderia dilworthii TaxID=948106 RepID=A0ABW9D5D8_9BURK